MVGGFKVISGDGGTGKGVGRRPVSRQILKGIALLGVKHLVLQVMGHPGGGVPPGPVLAEAYVHASVVGGKEGVALFKLRLGEHKHRQAVFQLLPVHGLPQAGKFPEFQGVSPPFLSGDFLSRLSLSHQLLGGGGHLFPGDAADLLHQLGDVGLQTRRRLA